MSSTTSSTPSAVLPTNPITVDPESTSTSSVLYSFLIVFLTLFAFAVVGAILWHHMVARRMRRVVNEVQPPWDIVETKGKKTWKKPDFWDVWIDEGSVALAKWEVLLPLAVRKCPSAPNDAQHEYSASIVHLARESTRPSGRPPTSTDVEVAVLIAMPAPRHPKDNSRVCDIGTTYTPYWDTATCS